MIQYAKRMGAMAYTANVVSNLFGAMTNPDIISFGGGAPAKEALPIDILRQLRSSGRTSAAWRLCSTALSAAPRT